METTKKLLWYRNGFFTLFADGKIRKPDGYLSNGNSWKWLGLLKVLPFGQLSRDIIPPSEAVEIPTSELKYKNGKYRYRVVDLDHGTIRIWMQ